MVAIATERLTKVFENGTVAVHELSIEVASGEFFVLLGPTGCGKSTILRLVAGLDTQTHGHVRIDGQIVDHLGASERRVAMVFQDYALYPHLTVEQNIGFPLRMYTPPGVDVGARVAEVAEQLGITGLLRRFPTQISGGQRQRVAMARAIVRKPNVFLLDEPLSNLDAGLRADLRADVAALSRRLGVTTLYVTHDQVEAMTMADRVAVLRRGVLQQLGPPEEVYSDPATVFVAAFLGTPRTNLLQAAVYAQERGRVVLDLGSQVLELDPGDRRTAALASHHTERVTVALRADALRPVPDDGSRLAVRGTVRTVENLGHEALVHVDVGAVPTAIETSRLEFPESGHHLSEVMADDLPAGHPVRDTLARMLPHHRPAEPPPTARTQYGFYPVYDPELPGEPPAVGEVVIRVPAPLLPRTGEPMTLAVDLDRLMLFDRAGNRIRLT
ncbi:MAG TPA: ABC transporter ATP-binding protein [Pilimelia sp.]|nr:ABC transporter ATP-binding protein [Pilimelia sp.]